MITIREYLVLLLVLNPQTNNVLLWQRHSPIILGSRDVNGIVGEKGLGAGAQHCAQRVFTEQTGDYIGVGEWNVIPDRQIYYEDACIQICTALDAGLEFLAENSNHLISHPLSVPLHTHIEPYLPTALNEVLKYWDKPLL